MTLNTPLPPESPAKPETSGMATASLVLGIVGPCTLGLASIVGAILGVVALVRIGRSAGQLAGRGLAIAGMVISAVGIPVAWLLLIPSISGNSIDVIAKSSASNISELYQVAMVYAASHKNTFPSGATWPEELQTAGLPDSVLLDPSGKTPGRVYAINAMVAGKPLGLIRRPSQTVLFFECAPGAPPAGGPDALPTKPRFGTGHHIGFCDGHVERIPIEELGRLIWNPEEERPKE
ncbi:MAG: DUF4190 domain-containing protein [Planctomycetota bacterium]|nr:DUF4190 domain-containing protein [Planctomycetota bacterium]